MSASQSGSSLELEFVRYDKLQHILIFAVNILFRNMHEHSDFEFNYVLSGRAAVRCREKEYMVEPGDFLMFSPYEPHEIRSCDAHPVQILAVQISKHFCEDYFPQFRNILFHETLLSQELADDQYRQVRHLFFSVCSAFFSSKPSFQLECVGRLCHLFCWLLDNVPNSFIDERQFNMRRRKFARARRILDYIDQHYRERLTLQGLAETENISTTYLSHFFHDNLNITFQDYLNRIRMEHAIYLMQNTNMCITDVCLESGFSDNKYLNQMLEREFGCKASEFRKRYAQTELVQQENDSGRLSSEHILTAQETAAVLRRHRLLQNS